MAQRGVFLKRMLKIGLYDDMPFLLRQRIFLSNLIGLILAVICFLYASIVVLGMRGNVAASLSLLPAFLMGISVFWLNHERLNILSRFILSVAPSITTLILNLSIKIYNSEQIGLVHYISPRFFIISTLIAPLVFFTTAEWVYLVLALGIILMTGTLAYVWLHKYYGIWITDLGIDDKAYLEVMTEDFTLVILTLLIVLIFFRVLNYQYEKLNQSLLKEAKQQNERLNENGLHLKQILKEVETRKEIESRQAWVSSGLAKFSRFLQEATAETAFYQQLIGEIVKYVGAWQGAIYTTEEIMKGDRQLVWQGGYAVSVEDMYGKKCQVGEGLIGRCAQSGKTLHIQQVPEAYSNFKTGLSEIKPQALLIVALKYQDYTEGIIELLASKKFEPHEIEFVERLSENIGVVFFNLKINQRTQQLLENSQKMFDNMVERQTQWQIQEKAYLHEIEMLKQQNTLIKKEN